MCVYGYLDYPTDCGRFWDRDLNAARNIGWAFMGWWFSGERPPHLRRPPPPSLTLSVSSVTISVSTTNTIRCALKADQGLKAEKQISPVCYSNKALP